ncbi:major facilitator superfamily domain-containing protein 6 [Trichonephila clavipes]|nr:major facilitator superfamily domain-containing protein 6 [Trichonephila clavipes]
MSFTRRSSFRRPQNTSHREGHHIVRNASVQPTASSATIQAQVAPSLGVHVASRNIRRHHPLRVLLLNPTHRRLHLEWRHVRGNWTSVKWNQVNFSDERRLNLSCDDNRVHVRRPVVNASILPLLHSDTPFPQLI